MRDDFLLEYLFYSSQNQCGICYWGCARACSVDSKIGYLLGSTRVCQKKLPEELWPHRSPLPVPASLPSSVSPKSPSLPRKMRKGGRNEIRFNKNFSQWFWFRTRQSNFSRVFQNLQFCIHLRCVEDALSFE